MQSNRQVLELSDARSPIGFERGDVRKRSHSMCSNPRRL